MFQMRILDISKKLYQKLKGKVNKELLTYMVFILIAVVIWYLNALSKEYTADLKFTVKYSDLPEDMVLANSPPDRLILTVSAQGFSLLKYRLGLVYAPVTLEANYTTMRRKNAATGEYALITQSMFNRIAAQLSSELHLRHVAPDTLHFIFSESVRREIPVMPVMQLQMEKGFLPKGKTVVEPETVTVTGPKTIVDTMQYVYTREKSFRRLKDNIRTALELQPVQRLRYSVDEVNAVQAIERYTEATITAPVEPINMPEGLTMKVFPGTVTIHCMVPVADYEKLQSFMFRAVVDYFSVKDEKDNSAKAKVTILRTPDYVTDVKHHPENVDFIIEK